MTALQQLQPVSAAGLPWDSALAMLQQHMTKVCSEASSVCVTDYESGDDAAVHALVGRSELMLASALQILDVVTLLYDADEGQGGNDAEAEAPLPDGDRVSSLPPPDGASIADAVVLARMGLRGRQRQLLALGERASRWERLAVAGSALRTVQKSLSSVDRTMADAERIPPSVNFYRGAVERSLIIRRRYVELHRAVVKTAPPQLDELRARLRLIGNAIALLLGLDVATHLRTGDRALLMIAHARIREWLTQRSDDPQHAAAGQRLWQDMNNISTMFLEVNKREELVQHDARLVHEALCELGAEGGDELAQERSIQRLSVMLGRSPSLDALLEQPWQADMTKPLQEALQDLARTLGAGGLTADDTDPPSGPRRCDAEHRRADRTSG